VKGMENVGDISEEDIKVMFDTNVTGLINVIHSRIIADIDDTSYSSFHETT
jgi:NADP-dependent 3-hydroxy acid dehydrogenase YdfG